jgi:hypothetical protein
MVNQPRQQPKFDESPDTGSGNQQRKGDRRKTSTIPQKALLYLGLWLEMKID